MVAQSETLTLDFPMQLADRLLASVTMRRPTMKDLRQYPVRNAEDFDGEFRQFAALCNLRVEELEAMDAADYSRLQSLYLRFRTPAERRGDPGSGAEPVPADPVGAA
ncbi:MAG: phage tail assembly protein [Desulfobulbus sp.]|nr:phage tail assembly protein [Desulfobulbus sp.]